MRTATHLGRLACLTGVLLLTGPSTAADPGQTIYSGRAYAASVRSPLLRPVVLSDTGPLPPGGGVRSAGLLTASVPGTAQAEVLVASTVGDGGHASSSAALAQIVLLPGHPAELQAAFVRAEASVSCDGGGAASEIVSLVFAGQVVQVSGMPNQTIAIPGLATLVINEQEEMHASGSHQAVVNALHLTVPGVTDVVLAHAEAGVQCSGQPPPGPCHDFVTGGGFIPKGGSHVNFGFNAGLHEGATAPTVHFNLVDHDSGMHMKATSISVYSVGSTSTTRHLEGECQIDGLPGYAYSIDVADNGEPGKDTDFIRVDLSNGYSASGLLAGGNVQLHDPCP